MTANFISAYLDAITLDDGIGEQLVGNLRRKRLRLRLFSGSEIQLEILALADILDAGISERVQSLRNGAALWIEHRWFQRNKDSRSHVGHSPLGEVNAGTVMNPASQQVPRRRFRRER